MADYRKQAAFRAAQLAQERMLEYLEDVITGVVNADPSSARALVSDFEKNFKEWMSMCDRYNV